MQTVHMTCVVALLFAGPVHALENAFAIGASSVVITPEVSQGGPPVWLAGYGLGRQAEGVHDDLYARAMFLHDGHFGVAIVACDLIGLFRSEVELIRAEIARAALAPPIDYVLVCSTHTHAGPDTLGIWGPVGRTGASPEYLTRVRGACVRAIRSAHAGARPGRLRIASADVNKSVELIGDSRRPIVIDSRLTVIQGLDPDGKVIVTLVNMPCHPEVLGSKNKQVSSDFPSTMRSELESRFGGTALYCSGAIGGLLSPREPEINPFNREPLPPEEIAKMPVYGCIIARIAEDAIAEARPLTGPVRATSRTVLLPLWNPMYKVAASLKILRREVFDADGHPVDPPRPFATATSSAPATVPDLYLQTEVGVLQIGSLHIAAIPGELYPELALGRFESPQDPGADYPGAPKEPSAFAVLGGEYQMVIGLANDEIGYIIPRSQWDWAAPYAYGRKERQYGESNSCGPEAAPKLMATLQALAQ